MSFPAKGSEHYEDYSVMAFLLDEKNQLVLNYERHLVSAIGNKDVAES